MKSLPAAISRQPIALAAALLLAGCTSFSGDGFFGGDKVDYRNSTARTQPLEVPPDLTQLSRDSRYQPQGGVVSAAAAAANPSNNAGAPGMAAAAAGPTVALNAVDDMRIVREGQLRWLVVPLPPEQLWPLLRTFWEQRGFNLKVDNAAVGVMETEWSENRAKLPSEATGNAVGRLLGRLYDTGERDRYRTRVERTAKGSEVYISHSGVQEVYTNAQKDDTTWRGRPNDPQLEAEFLSQLMVQLGAKQEPARAALAAASAPRAAAPVATVAGATSLVVAEPFDRAWRRVGLALDRTGFTVEDRDRAGGLYFVRYVDPKNVGKEEPGWWARLWGDKSNPQEALRYRVVLKAAGEKTDVSVQNSAGAVETGDNAQRIIALIQREMR